MRRFVAPSTALLAVAALLPIVAAPRASAASGTVTGRVFQDYNSNGAYDTTESVGVAIDRGLSGVRVRAFDSAGALVGQTTTAADGTYTLNATLATTTDVRVEFDHLVNPDLAEYEPSFVGADSGGSVQFVTLPAAGVDYGLNLPGDYCQNNPTLVTCVSQRGTGASDNVGAFTVPSAVDGFVSIDANDTRIGSSADLGSIFGIGADRSRNAFFGTYVKRHVEYGKEGAVNAIYRINLDHPGVVTTFVVLPGTLPAHDATAPGSLPAYTGDTGVFDDVGRIGLGDVDVTPDGSTLLAVDMDQSAPKLYFVPIEGTGDSVTAGEPVFASIPKPATFGGVACPGTWHPMGIGVRGGRILVGGTCGAENTVTPSTPRGTSLTSSTLFVVEYEGALDGSGSFSTIWAEGLDYERTCLYREGTRIACDPASTGVDSLYTADWAAWNEYPNLDLPDGPTGSMVATNPQAMLSNVEISDTGGLIISLRDRFQDQVQAGAAAYSLAYEDPAYPAPPKAYPTSIGTFAGGDILRVCMTGSGLVTESDGTCVDLAGSGSTEYGAGKEYYYDGYPGFADESGNPLHPETANGATAAMPGYPGVWGITYDVNRTGSQGVMSWGACDAAPGACRGPSSGYGSQTGGWDLGNLNGFNKGNGMSDLEVLCDMAPVQIGNRLWFDEDRDGIQDPGEEPIVGATVRLYDADGVVVGTAVTNAAGEYFFESSLSEAAAGNGDARGGGLEPGEPFTVRMDNPADYAAGGPLSGLVLTDTSGSTPVGSDQEGLIDSDGSPSGSGAFGSGSFPQVAVPALEPGVNDHSFDVGFVRPVVAVGDFVWVDEDRDGVQDVGEPPLQWTKVELFNADGTRARDADGELVDPVYTDAAGRYLFDNLSPGDYRVKFTPPNPAVSSFTDDLVGGGGADSDADQLTGLSEVFTLAAAVTGDMVADTDPATVASYVNPTIDAGVVLGVRVGNRVWVDADGDGVQDPEDRGLGGATVTLTDMAGNPVVDLLGRPVGPQVTDAEGRYLFSNLPPGQYRTTVTYPPGTFPTRAGVGDPGSDSSTTTAVSRVLAAGEQDLTLDFGVVTGTVAVGDRVWVDGNRDGRQSPGERGLAGARLLLFNADGTRARDVTGRLVPARVTGRDGKYLFSNLPPGQYVTRITYPRGWTRTTVGVGPRETDSAGRRARSLVLVAGERDLTLDFGVVPVRRLARTI